MFYFRNSLNVYGIMNGDRGKRGTFMIADILCDLSPSKPKSPPDIHNSDSATGSDVIVDDVIDYSAQSPVIITSRGRTENSRCGEHGTNRHIRQDDSCYSVDVTVPVDRVALFSTAETFPSSHSSALSSGGLPQRREPSSSCCFQEAGVLPGGADDEGLRAMASAANVARLSLNHQPVRRCVTPLHWHSVIQHAIRTAGQNRIISPGPNMSLIWQ